MVSLFTTTAPALLSGSRRSVRQRRKSLVFNKRAWAEVESNQLFLIVMRSIVKRLNYSSRLYTETKIRQGGYGYSPPAVVQNGGDFPYGFFCGLVGFIGLCLLSWTMYAKHQQEVAVADCIETETHAKTLEGSEQDEPNGVEAYNPIAEDQLNRASAVCEMKCLRGNLSGCQ